MRVGRQVERWQSRDGKHVLRFFGRDEHVYFVEFSEVADKGESFWATTRTSEEFGSLETARKAALLQLPWLKEAIASGRKAPE
jgi:hypothetical protein